MTEESIKTQDGAYGHHATVDATRGRCDRCKHEDIKVLEVDTSDAEYAVLHICMECINSIMDKVVI